MRVSVLTAEVPEICQKAEAEPEGDHDHGHDEERVQNTERLRHKAIEQRPRRATCDAMRIIMRR